MPTSSKDRTTRPVTFLILLLIPIGAAADPPTGPAAKRPAPVIAPRPGPPPVRKLTTLERDLLAFYGVTTEPDSLRQFLRSGLPSDTETDVLRLRVQDLDGDTPFAKREAAARALLRTPPHLLTPLITDREDRDWEWTTRTETIRKVTTRNYRRTLGIVTRLVIERELTELTGDLLALAGHVDCSSGLMNIQRAVYRTVNNDHIPLLKRSLTHPSPQVRQLAAIATRELNGSVLASELEALRNDKSETVRLWVAWARLSRGHADAVGDLIDLLNGSKLPETRSLALSFLNTATGQSFVTTPSGENTADGSTSAKRPNNPEAWSKWWNLAQADFVPTPLPGLYESTAGFLNGNTLLATGYKNQVIELDPDNNVVFEYEAKGAWSAEKLANGNYLIAAHSENRVIEVDSEKNVVREISVRFPIAAYPMIGGNILVTCYQPGRVLEINPAGETVWEHTAKTGVYDAHPLPNGNVMLTNGSVVQEITREHNVVWQQEAGRPYGFSPLPNGHVLICNSKEQVFEVDRLGQTHWSFKVTGASDAFRLNDGNTLITTSKEIIEVTPDGEVVWKWPNVRYGSARR